MMKYIGCFHRCWSFLFTTKDQINPFIQMCRNIITFQSLKRMNLFSSSFLAMLTIRWIRINSRQSFFDQAGRITSFKAIPFCFFPKIQWPIFSIKQKKRNYWKCLTQIEFICIDQKIWKVEKFRYEFLHISHIISTSRKPRIFNTVKHSIGKIEMTTLKMKKEIFFWKRKCRREMTCKRRKTWVNGSIRTRYEATIIAEE